MPRRASSSVPIWIVLVSVVFLAAAIAGGSFLYRRVSDPYRTLQALDVSAYLENANSLRGNVYKLNGTIGTSLSWSPLVGRLFSVEVEGHNGTDVLPVLIPADFNHLNIQKGQRYFFKTEVGEKGILRAQDVRKV